MLINGSDPIDADSVNDVYTKIDNVKDKLIQLIWRNTRGDSDKTLKSLDGKRIQVLAATVPVEDKKSKDDEVSIHVNFSNNFGGNKHPTVVAMPVSGSPYGVSVKNIDSKGFDLVIHQFADGKGDNSLPMAAINYIAVGQP
jgi:hypothetical protein